MANTPPGPAVDASGQSVVDPTENVKADIASAVRRLDDLRQSEARHVREIMEIQRLADQRCLDNQRSADQRERDIQRETDKERRADERERLNSIRDVDITAVQRAAEAQEIRATTLQAQVAAAAEVVRVQQQANTTAITEGYTNALKPLVESVARLQEQMFRQAGEKAQVVESRDVRGSGRGDLTTVLLGVGLLVTVLLGVLGLLLQ